MIVAKISMAKSVKLSILVKKEIFIFTVDQIVHRQFLHFEHFKGNFFMWSGIYE